MKCLLNGQEMKQCDKNTMDYFKVPSEILMERAALSAVHEILRRRMNVEKVLCVCGSGNNGGDGIAVARLLFLKGIDVEIFMLGNPMKATKQTSLQLSIAKAYGIPFVQKVTENDGYTLIIDAIFGIGLTREIENTYYDCIRLLNEMDARKVALDIPSGVSSDDGSIKGIAFHADYTITFGFEKVGQYLFPGADYCGHVIRTDMGIDGRSLLDLQPTVFRTEGKDLSLLPKRYARSNKGTYGKVLVIAGSENMAGAAVFSAQGSYAAGAGLVRIYTPESNRIILQTLVPEAILSTYPDGVFDVNGLNEAITWADSVVIGPGIGLSDVSAELVRYTLSSVVVPCVIDADALTLISIHPEFMYDACEDWILTPHPGEMSRLCDETVSGILNQILKTAVTYAVENQVITVLKDAHTITASPDEQVYINNSGNPGMSTGGSGDVLTGVIAALAAQGCEPKVAAWLGVYVHGLAGDQKSKECGTYGLTASHIVEGVRMVMKEGEKNVTL